MRNGALNTPIKHLRKDLYAVACDAEALLKATADVASDQVQQARTRTQRTVQRAFDQLYAKRWRRHLGRQLGRAADSTDTYVREHPWAIVGAAVAAGLIIGLIARRR